MPLKLRPRGLSAWRMRWLMLERILGIGQFKSPAALAAKLGISRSVVSELLGMLNLPPAEIERILFETRV